MNSRPKLVPLPKAQVPDGVFSALLRGSVRSIDHFARLVFAPGKETGLGQVQIAAFLFAARPMALEASTIPQGEGFLNLYCKADDWQSIDPADLLAALGLDSSATEWSSSWSDKLV